jgi:hypothetical protein
VVGVWSIIPVDGAPLRKKAQREYQKALRDLDSAKAQLAEFHERDEPLFSQWISQNFGALLTGIRELQARLMESEQLIAEVEQEHFFGGHRSMASAYREVMRRRAQPAEAAEEIDEEEAEQFRREFEEAFTEAAEDFWQRFGRQAHARGQAVLREKGKEARRGNSRLKDLYRTLARRLHPDTGNDLSANEKEWWHQTQAAYDSGNLEQLELILTLVEIEDKGTRETSVSALAKLTASFKQRLRSLKKQLTELSREAAWKFSQRSDRSLLFARVQSSLKLDQERLASILEMHQAQIAKWERQRAPAPNQKRRRRASIEDEFLF